MDHPFTFNSFVAVIVASLTFIIMAIQRYNRKMSSKKNLPPGPRRLPIIGNMHQISSLPHRSLTEMGKKHGPVMYLELGEVPLVVVSSLQASEEVLRTSDISLAQRPVTAAAEILTYNCNDIVFAPYGEYWRQMKKIFVVHLTSAKQVASFRSVREAEVTTLVGSIVRSSSGGKLVNLTKMFYTVVTSILSRATFGDSCKQLHAFSSLVPRISEILSRFSIAEFFPSVGVLERISGMRGKALRLHQEIDEVLESVIQEYRASTKKERNEASDILGFLLNLQDECDPDVSLTTESIKAILFDVFFAGTDTSATILDWIMSEIMRHPEIMEKVQAEVRQIFSNKMSIDEASLHQLKYMDAVIKESFRLHPPALLVPREARESMTINGYEIHPKTRVFVNMWAIGRDPKIWTDAEKFCPERFLNSSTDYKGNHLEFIPFGSGRRMCPGMMFGAASVQLIIANLLYHFDWELPGGLPPECLNMDEVVAVAVQRKHDLCLVASQYRP